MDLVPKVSARWGTYEYDLQALPISLTPTEEVSGFNDIGKVKFSVLRPQDYFDSGQFIENRAPQYLLDEDWIEDDENGFDIYIDSLHNLPDNCTCVKVLARLVNDKE